MAEIIPCLTPLGSHTNVTSGIPVLYGRYPAREFMHASWPQSQFTRDAETSRKREGRGQVRGRRNRRREENQKAYGGVLQREKQEAALGSVRNKKQRAERIKTEAEGRSEVGGTGDVRRTRRHTGGEEERHKEIKERKRRERSEGERTRRHGLTQKKTEGRKPETQRHAEKGRAESRIPVLYGRYPAREFMHASWPQSQFTRDAETSRKREGRGQVRGRRNRRREENQKAYGGVLQREKQEAALGSVRNGKQRAERIKTEAEGRSEVGGTGDVRRTRRHTGGEEERHKEIKERKRRERSEGERTRRHGLTQKKTEGRKPETQRHAEKGRAESSKT
ncbi:vicilin-like seed storage protein At2g18540 [Malus domestica]|uniref:vicilin-like seed storage protein At2g18540 n=1 Tax=Malus domestica TaxID=3750 RepID=UPI003976D309